jgi:hypothetical protein
VKKESKLVGESLDGVLPGLVLEVSEQLQEHLFLAEEEATERLPRDQSDERRRGRGETFSSESL